ncbi:MAG TPA: hypothetical protein VL426_06090 [Candidatus Binatia bacterium]|nr:hypothetical protein [Candidatus Binatia bacterium]
MPLDLEKEAAECGCTLTALRRWRHDGHEVALVRYEKKDADPPYADMHLVCECDFLYEDVVQDGKVVGRTHPKDPHDCRAKKAVMAEVRAEARKTCAEVLRKDGLKAAILDVQARVKAGEYLGQTYASMIYVQEVADILGKENRAVLDAIDALFAEEKLDLNGMILIDHEKRFRFPKEVQTMFRILVEEPLGWPNGDAGDCFVGTLETAIHAHTPYQSGSGAFWPHNYPHVAPHHLAQLARYFLAFAHDRASRDPAALADLGDPAEIAASLDALAARFRALAPPKPGPSKPRKRKKKKTR